MKIPFRINDDIIISNNDKDNDVPNGCLINTAEAGPDTGATHLTLTASLQLSSQWLIHEAYLTPGYMDKLDIITPAIILNDQE